MSGVFGINREYRDRLFKFIFGNPDNKEWTLSLYNAVNGSNYTDVNAMWFNTIDDAVYMSMKNDVSFLIEDTMNFYEQQSTFNPNMPMRFLIYAGMAYSKYVQTSGTYHRYSSLQQKAPAPRCICFYNGTVDKEDRVILSLTDAFDGCLSDIEVKVTMININYGHNKEILSKCKPLKEYAWFVDKVRSNRESVASLENAIDTALDEMPDDFLIKPFLLMNKAEVRNMCITEYDEEKTFAEQRDEGRAEGFLEAMTVLVKEGILTLSQAAAKSNMTESEFEMRTGLKS